MQYGKHIREMLKIPQKLVHMTSGLFGGKFTGGIDVDVSYYCALKPEMPDNERGTPKVFK